MASRMMHLAIADMIAKKFTITDYNRFRIGSILPDAYASGAGTQKDSHLKVKICDGTKMTYNLEEFRDRFAGIFKSDDLYLGYYMHLIQDIVFRDIFIVKYRWLPKSQEDVKKLHNDYRLMNPYIIRKYDMKNNLGIPEGLQEEEIYQWYPFEIEESLLNLRDEFEPYHIGQLFFFTEGMVDEYIELAVTVCMKEMTAIYENKTLMNSLDYAWTII